MTEWKKQTVKVLPQPKAHHIKGFSSICVDCYLEVAALDSDPVCRPHVHSLNRDGCQVCSASGMQIAQGVPCQPKEQPMIAAFQGNGTNATGPLRIDASIPVRVDTAMGPPPETLLTAPIPYLTIERALILAKERLKAEQVNAERGPGIAAKDLTPKAPDYSGWCDETNLLPDAEG